MGYPSKIQCSTSFWINMASDVFFRDVAHLQTSPCVNPWARRSVKVPYYWDPSCNSNRVSLGCWADARSLGVLGQGMARGRDPWMVSKVTSVNTFLIVETTLVGGLEHVFFHILGIIIPTDEVIFFRGVGQPPTSASHLSYRSCYLWFGNWRHTYQAWGWSSHRVPFLWGRALHGNSLPFRCHRTIPQEVWVRQSTDQYLLLGARMHQWCLWLQGELFFGLMASVLGLECKDCTDSCETLCIVLFDLCIYDIICIWLYVYLYISYIWLIFPFHALHGSVRCPNIPTLLIAHSKSSLKTFSIDPSRREAVHVLLSFVHLFYMPYGSSRSFLGSVWAMISGVSHTFSDSGHGSIGMYTQVNRHIC